MAANDSTSNPLFAGISSAGSDIGAGIKQAILNYRDRQEREAAVTGQLEAMISSHGAAGIQALSPDGQKLAQKFISGDASYKEKLQLMGEGQTALALQEDAQKKAASQQALQMGQQAIQGTAQKYQMDQLNLEQAQRQNAFIKNILAGGQQGGSQQPQGGGMPQGTGPLANPQQGQGAPQAPIPATAVNPGMSGAINRYVRMTGVLPPTSTLNDMMKQNSEQAAQSRQMIGVVPAGASYKDGVPQGLSWKPVYKIGAGTPAEQTQIDDNGAIPSPLNQTPNGYKVLNPTTFQPAAPSELSAIMSPPPNNPNDPTWQADRVDADAKAGASAVGLAKAKLLQQAAAAYNADPVAGGKFRAFLANPEAAKLIQTYNGTNALAALQTAISSNVAEALEPVRGPNGSLGLKTTQNEFQVLLNTLGKAGIPADQLTAATNNIAALQQRRSDLDSGYATYRKTMLPGDAADLALSQYGKVPDMSVSSTPLQGLFDKYKVQVPSAPNSAPANGNNLY